MLQRYGNRAGNSGVRAYEEFPDGIRVQFVDGVTYDYSFESAGRENVERMKQLARAGEGLSAFISRHVRQGFSSRGPGRRSHEKAWRHGRASGKR